MDVSNSTEIFDLNCRNNEYPVFASHYGLSNLPKGFNITKFSDWEVDTVDVNILTFNECSTEVIHKCDCENDPIAHFKLNILLMSTHINPVSYQIAKFYIRKQKIHYYNT